VRRQGSGGDQLGAGVWQRVTVLHKARKDFVHINATQANLFPPASDADDVISTVRDAVTDIYARAGKACPSWLRDDEDKGWDRARDQWPHGTVVNAGVDPAGADTVRIAYEHKGKEYDSDLFPPGTN